MEHGSDAEIQAEGRGARGRAGEGAGIRHRRHRHGGCRGPVWLDDIPEGRYPAYVFHYTDFSSGRKDPLKKDLRVAATEEQINAIFDAFVAENVKKGWTEV